MQDEREKVVELLKSGKYYDEALKWYNSRYIMPKTQLATIGVLAAIAFTFFFTSLVTTISIFPLTALESFDVNRPMVTGEGIAVKALGSKNENATRAYLRYMLAEYVKSREEYNPAKVDRDFNFVIELSSDPIFMDYLTLADPKQNPNHPVWKYGSQAIREIFVTKTVLNDLDMTLKNYVPDKIYTANINFVSSLLFVDNLQTQEKFQAEVQFQFEPVLLDQTTNKIKQLPKLVITDYKTKKLKNL